MTTLPPDQLAEVLKAIEQLNRLVDRLPESAESREVQAADSTTAHKKAHVEQGEDGHLTFQDRYGAARAGSPTELLTLEEEIKSKERRIAERMGRSGGRVAEHVAARIVLDAMHALWEQLS